MRCATLSPGILIRVSLSKNQSAVMLAPPGPSPKPIVKFCYQFSFFDFHFFSAFECKLAFFVDSLFASVMFFGASLFSLRSARDPSHSAASFESGMLITQLAAAQDAACLQSAVQLVAVSASTVDDDPWRALHK